MIFFLNIHFTLKLRTAGLTCCKIRAKEINQSDRCVSCIFDVKLVFEIGKNS